MHLLLKKPSSHLGFSILCVLLTGNCNVILRKRNIFPYNKGNVKQSS